MSREAALLATEGATFHCVSGVRDRTKGVRDWKESCSHLSETVAGGMATRGAGDGRRPTAGHRKTLESETRNRAPSPVGISFPANPLRNPAMLESLRVLSVEAIHFSLTIITLFSGLEYSRIVVTRSCPVRDRGGCFSLHLRCSQLGERCSRLERILFAFERDRPRRHGHSRSRRWPPPHCRASKNTRRRNSKSGSKPRGYWLSAKSPAKPCTT